MTVTELIDALYEFNRNSRVFAHVKDSHKILNIEKLEFDMSLEGDWVVELYGNDKIYPSNLNNVNKLLRSVKDKDLEVFYFDKEDCSYYTITGIDTIPDNSRAKYSIRIFLENANNKFI